MACLSTQVNFHLTRITVLYWVRDEMANITEDDKQVASGRVHFLVV
jgi:hypothetical protein